LLGGFQYFPFGYFISKQFSHPTPKPQPLQNYSCYSSRNHCTFLFFFLVLGGCKPPTPPSPRIYATGYDVVCSGNPANVASPTECDKNQTVLNKNHLHSPCLTDGRRTRLSELRTWETVIRIWLQV